MHIFDSSAKLLMQIPDDWDPIFGDRGLLVGAQLPGGELRKLDLGNADLSNACLVGANLYGAFLNSAVLRHVNLEGACLAGADLEDTDLSFANLINADVGRDGMGRRARLGGADLTGANLTNARFEGALYDSTTIFPEGFRPEDHGMLKVDGFVLLGDSPQNQQIGWRMSNAYKGTAAAAPLVTASAIATAAPRPIQPESGLRSSCAIHL